MTKEIKFYSSDHNKSKYIYPANSKRWKRLSKKYLMKFETMEQAKEIYPHKKIKVN